MADERKETEAGEFEGRTTNSEVQEFVVRPSNSPASDKMVLMTLTVSGFAAMIYEVAWTRALSAMLGSSTYAFSIMLVTFLIGIALGSSIIGRRKPVATIHLLGLLQLGVATGGIIFIIGYLGAPYVLIALIRAFYYTFPAILTIQFMICSGLKGCLCPMF